MSATNSDPNVDDSTVVCFLENQDIGALFTYNTMPVCDLLVIWSPAWSASTKQLIWTTLPRGVGAFGGISSLASLYGLVQANAKVRSGTSHFTFPLKFE